MRKLLLIISILFTFASCSTTEKPAKVRFYDNNSYRRNLEAERRDRILRERREAYYRQQWYYQRHRETYGRGNHYKPNKRHHRK